MKNGKVNKVWPAGQKVKNAFTTLYIKRAPGPALDTLKDLWVFMYPALEQEDTGWGQEDRKLKQEDG